MTAAGAVRIARLASFALTVLGGIAAAAIWLYWQTAPGQGNPADLRIYLTTPFERPYEGWVLGAGDAFQYSPAFLQLVQPLKAVPFDVVLGAWRAVSLAIVVILAGPLTLPILLWGPVASEVNAGNVNLLIAAVVAVGFRRPAVWAFVLHTKITPAVGLLWFAVRRDWRGVGWPIGVAAGVAAVSFAISPGLWIDWVRLVIGNATSGAGVTTFPYFIPLTVRLPVAAVIVLIAGARGWTWPVAIAATIAAPVLYYPTQAIAIGALPELRRIASEWLRRRLPGEPWSADEATPQADEVPVQVVR